MTDELDKTIPPRRAGANMPDMDKTMPGYRDRQTDGRFAVGDLIMGRYKVLAELGQGGMGVVYKCFDETAGIEVALKALPPELSHNSLEMDDIKENFQLVSKLVHQNIAISKNLERNHENGNYYLIMECCEGEDLRRWIKRKRRDNPLTLNDVLPVIRQVADALDYAHGEKVMHRDIKPGNIMIDSRGKVKVLDFGLAAQIHTSMTRVSMAYHGTSGTGPYMAPEQWRGKKQGAASDQYALAVMTYEMLSGDLPFESPDPAVLQQAVLTQEADPIEGLPATSWKALQRAMSKEAADRFSSCADFAAALGGAKVVKSKKVSSGKSGGAWTWIAAVIVLALIAAGAFFALNRNTATPTVHVPADTAADAEAHAKAAEQKAADAEARARAEAEALRLAAEKKAAEEKVKALKEAAAAARLTVSGPDATIVTGVMDKNVGHVVIPNGIKRIGSGAFSGCDKLISITIPDSVTSIGDGAFSDCISLERITIPDSVTSIGAWAFADCTSLTSITIPNSVTSIGAWAFADCTSLTSITIPDSVTSIGDNAFLRVQSVQVSAGNPVFFVDGRGVLINKKEKSLLCAPPSLSSYTIPDSVTSIGIYAFAWCKNLTSVTIGNSVTSIGNSAFSGCDKLISITIPDSVTSIGFYAFAWCKNLTSITIPDSVTSIGEGAFSGCKNLTSITIPRHFTEATVRDWFGYKEGIPAGCEVIRK